MDNLMLKIHLPMRSLMQRNEGQDLVEYSLVFVILAFACVASMGSVAADLNSAFLIVGQTLSTSIS